MGNKYDTCIHAESVGTYAVYVKPSCPRASMIKGRMVSSKKRCEECRSYKPRKETLRGLQEHKPRKGAGDHAKTEKTDT